jgi:sugar lactone lactonase YvrE
MAPNDLVADARGGIYFTDPDLDLPGRKVPTCITRPTCITCRPATVVVDDQIVRPNGLVLTPNGKTLIVSDTAGDAVFAYDMRTDGTATNKRIFAMLCDVPAGRESLADGMAVDRDGRLYVTTSACSTSPRSRASIASRRWRRGRTGLASDDRGRRRVDDFRPLREKRRQGASRQADRQCRQQFRWCRVLMVLPKVTTDRAARS